MPAGLFGQAEWVGYLPLNTVRVAVSDAVLADLSCELMTLRTVLAVGLVRNLPTALWAIRLALTGRRAEAREELRIACSSRSLRDYHRWRLSSYRTPDEAGVDAPREAWQSGPHVCFMLDRAAGSEHAIEATLKSLREQTYKRWSVTFIEPTQKPDEPQAGTGASLAELRAGDFIAPLRPGDVLPPYALAAFAEHVLKHPQADLLYGDEESVDDRGRHIDPQLKPDWSPAFQSSRQYVDQAVYVRVSTIAAAGTVQVRDLAQADRLWALVWEEAKSIQHVRRVLLTKATPESSRKSRRLVGLGRPSMATMDASATIIIPSKDRPDLLGPCLASLRDSQPANFEVVVADNGSERAETHSLYRSASGDPRIRILTLPGPFNFSALCNQAAAAAHGRVLVFLNDDTIAIQPDWLARLAGWALRAECGAIGAKLLYPSGRVQHGGLVVGLGGYAAHIESGVPSNDPGYLDRLDAAHEVSAVTGACLAVEKAKFDAVHGFDAERFPVELGDVDLCLRLEARGWKTIFTAEAVLIHRESASRGRARDREIRYAREHGHFIARWRSRIHDDPFFHPALSLSSLRTRLDG